MQPNKSVEEWRKKFDAHLADKNIPWEVRQAMENFVTSHTNTVLQGVVERVEKLKEEIKSDEDDPFFEYPTNEKISLEKAKGINTACDYILSLLNDQVISNEEKKETWETKVGMLRQWLNEDRITDPQKMVTNEQIIKWLE